MHSSNKSTCKLTQLLLLACLIFITTVYAQDSSISVNQVSIDSHYHVSYQSKLEPLPLNQIHRWVLHIKNKDGQPVENAIVLIDGGMPAHNHGLPTQPVATEIGNGDYLVEGMKFSMTGMWEIWFHIQSNTVTDKVKFVLEF